MAWLGLSCVLWHFFCFHSRKNSRLLYGKACETSSTCTAHCISLSRYFCQCHFYNTHKYSSTLFIQSTHTTIKNERIKTKEQNIKRRTWCMDLHLTLKVQQYPLPFRNARRYDDDDDDLFLFLKGRILEWIKYFVCVYKHAYLLFWTGMTWMICSVIWWWSFLHAFTLMMHLYANCTHYSSSGTKKHTSQRNPFLCLIFCKVHTTQLH